MLFNVLVGDVCGVCGVVPSTAPVYIRKYS